MLGGGGLIVGVGSISGHFGGGGQIAASGGGGHVGGGGDGDSGGGGGDGGDGGCWLIDENNKSCKLGGVVSAVR